MICSGRTSPSACELKRDSLTMSPARKAPSDTLTPAIDVAYAVPMQIAITVSRNSSGEQVAATRSSTGGSTRRANTSTRVMIATAVASATATSPERPAGLAEDGHEQHHRDDREVLEEQHGDRDPPVVCGHLAAIGEDLQHDRRGRQRHQQAGEQGHARVDARGEQDSGRGEGREGHLQPAADEQRAAQPLRRSRLNSSRW
jgi:hypothetical protein